MILLQWGIRIFKVKMQFFLLFLLFLISSIIPLPGQAEFLPQFSPGKQKSCESGIVEWLDQAKTSVDIAIYAINNKAITSAILRVKERKIKLRIIADKLQAGAKNSMVLELYQRGVNIRVNSKNRIMHNKFMIIDKVKLETGSYNFTEAATNKNAENCNFITNEANIAKYNNVFEKLWSINHKDKSEAWFTKKIQN